MAAMISSVIVVAAFGVVAGLGLVLVVALLRVSGRSQPGAGRGRTGSRTDRFEDG